MKREKPVLSPSLLNSLDAAEFSNSRAQPLRVSQTQQELLHGKGRRKQAQSNAFNWIELSKRPTFVRNACVLTRRGQLSRGVGRELLHFCRSKS